MSKFSVMNKVEFGKRIKDLRTSKRWTQKELADLSKVGLTTIKEIEWGTRDPSISVVEKIAGVFTMKMEEILYGEGAGFTKDLETRFKQIAFLEEEEQKMICTMIDSIILKHQMQELNKSRAS